MRYGTQIADALAHAHRGGVTHRDLKSANVLITRDGRPKVLDFGLARALSRETLSDMSQSRASITAEGAVAGTLSVMAPEMLRGEPADERSDIWSLGVLLYEMASGERPFRGATGFELSGAILHAPPAPLPERVPARSRALFINASTKIRSDRYQNGGDVRAALESAPRTVQRGCGVCRPSSRSSGFRSSSRAFSWRCGVVFFRDGGMRTLSRSARPAGRRLPSCTSRTPAHRIPIPRGCRAACRTCSSRGSRRRAAWRSSASGVCSRRSDRAARRTLSSLDRTKAADVARRAGAGAIVVGSIFHARARRFASTRRSKISRPAASSQRRPCAAPTCLRSSISWRPKFATPSVSTMRRQVRNVANVSSRSLEAYRLYSEAVKAASNLRMADAEKLFKAAIAIDPSFAEAYLHLAHVSGHLGRKDGTPASTSSWRWTMRTG